MQFPPHAYRVVHWCSTQWVNSHTSQSPVAQLPCELAHCSVAWLVEDALVLCFAPSCSPSCCSLSLQVSLPTFELGLPAYYVLALSEASSNLSRYDGVRYGLRATHGAAGRDLKDMYCSTRGEGLGSEVKRRILMGTYALSAGYYDAYYKRAQQVSNVRGL